MIKIIRVEDLNILPYADDSFGEPQYISFTLEEIREAIAENRYDKRSFQGDIDTQKGNRI